VGGVGWISTAFGWCSANYSADFSTPSRRPTTGSLRTAVFINTSLAKTWKEDAETANPEPLLARRENYAADALPYRILYLTASVDVQDDRFEIEVVGWRQDLRRDPEESWGVIDEVIYGDLGKGEI
jgi:phage terminase large subunit GpA-like protein